MKDLLEKLLTCGKDAKEDMVWWSWWIVDNKLIPVGREHTGGDHYGVVAITDNPGQFGLNANDIEKLKQYQESLNKWYKDEGADDPDWEILGDVTGKVMKKSIRVGVHKQELYADIPTADTKWLELIQRYRSEFESHGPIKYATVFVTSTTGVVKQDNYVMPIDDLWSANTFNDLRQWKQ